MRMLLRFQKKAWEAFFGFMASRPESGPRKRRGHFAQSDKGSGNRLLCARRRAARTRMFVARVTGYWAGAGLDSGLVNLPLSTGAVSTFRTVVVIRASGGLVTRIRNGNLIPLP